MGFEQEWPPKQEGLFCLIEEKKAGKFLAHNLSGSNKKFNSFNCIYSSKNFRLFYKPSSKSGLEISISKKYFRLAVKRNKIKRRLRSIMNDATKKISINFDYSYLVVSKPSMLENEFKNIKKVLFQEFERIK